MASGELDIAPDQNTRVVVQGRSTGYACAVDRERTIYDLLRALVTVASTDPQFVNQYLDESGRAEWFEVIDKAEKVSVFGEMARHL